MDDNLILAKSVLDEVLQTLKETYAGQISEDEMRDLTTRVQFARNTLIQNEKKIWLRTKVGREILRDFGAASGKLLDVLMGSQKSGGIESNILKADAALRDVESHAKRLNEETRRRSMVVT